MKGEAVNAKDGGTLICEELVKPLMPGLPVAADAVVYLPFVTMGRVPVRGAAQREKRMSAGAHQCWEPAAKTEYSDL